MTLINISKHRAKRITPNFIHSTDNYKMKKYIIASLLATFLLPLALKCQQLNAYEKLWSKANTLEASGLTKSALKATETILKKATAEKNEGEIIKSYVFLMHYSGITDENSLQNHILFIEKEIKQQKSPLKNILLSMNAEMYWTYLKNNRYKFYDRGKLQSGESNDISTWSISKLLQTITKKYEESLSNPSVLQQTNTKAFNPIILKGQHTEQLRPTLFDFLAHRALEFFKENEKDVVEAPLNFPAESAELFSPLAYFKKLSFEKVNTSSNVYHAIDLYQKLLQFHYSDLVKDALLDIDLQRIEYVYTLSTHTNKDQLYLNALGAIQNNYPTSLYAAQAAFQIASWHYAKGSTYQVFVDERYKKNMAIAKNICDSVTQIDKKSIGGASCLNLLQQILQPALQLQTEDVNLPKLPFRAFIHYKNTKEIFFKILKTNKSELQELDALQSEKLWSKLLSKKSIREWQQTIPATNDFQPHATEIKIDALPVGTYILIASLDPSFGISQNILLKREIQISTLSLIENNQQEYYVLNRNTGYPIKKAQVLFSEAMYDNAQRKYVDKNIGNAFTDENGKFTIAKNNNNKGISIQINYQEDEWHTSTYLAGRDINTYEIKQEKKLFLYTDRRIYRPGQLVFYKGIVLDKKQPALTYKTLENHAGKVQLLDPNGQKIEMNLYNSNSFGSFTGSFKIPMNVLNGQWSILDSASNFSINIQVEEYKRPKFYTDLKKPDGIYRINDTVLVKGIATAFAGNSIDGASVKYRVTRKTHLPFWRMNTIRFGRIMPPYFQQTQIEIKNGTCKTTANGTFEISFKAIADELIPKEDQPTFTYEINVDVTDVNGESNSSDLSINVSYQALNLSIQMPDEIKAIELNQIKINSNNINDIFEPTKAVVNIYKLLAPETILRNRLWERPDEFVMSRQAYKQSFPFDIYADENEMQSWPKGKVIVNKEMTTTKDGKFDIKESIQESGWYKLEVSTTDKYGELVKAEKYFKIYNTPPLNNKKDYAIDLKVNQTAAHPGDHIEYMYSTGFDSLWILQSVNRMESKKSIQYLNAYKNKEAENKIDILDNDRGGMEINYIFVKHNTVYKGSNFIQIPWDNKNLRVEYVSFRNKLLPGSKEKWQVKISGYQQEKVAAEMVVSMFDESLDQIMPHQWEPFNCWPSLSDKISWVERGFSIGSASEYSSVQPPSIEIQNKEYNQLGFLVNKESIYWRTLIDNNNSRYYYRTDRMPLAKAKNTMSEAMANNVIVQVADGAPTLQNEKAPGNNTDIRKNLSETGFFYPSLTTDAEGSIIFNAEIPEALTKWKLLSLAHSKTAASGYQESHLITQKTLMVQPNLPRFMRASDRMEIAVKIVNMSDTELTGTTVLQLRSERDQQSIDGWFKNIFPTQYFTIGPRQSTVVKFPIEVPANFTDLVNCRIIAHAGEYSDGEENLLPVVTNRILITESLPLNMQKEKTKKFEFKKLLAINFESQNNTLSNQSLTVEYTSNPIWYVVKALPYLMETEEDCLEQTFSKFYGNVIGENILHQNPIIKNVLNHWIQSDTGAFVSPLEKNENLHAILLKETPWVLDAKNERDQKSKLSNYFKDETLKKQRINALEKLKKYQLASGGFCWLTGAGEDIFMTQHILTGIGKLKKIEALTTIEKSILDPIVKNGLKYLDQTMTEKYVRLKKENTNLSTNNLRETDIQYLYMRSFFQEYPISKSNATAIQYFKNQAARFWIKQPKYLQAMIAVFTTIESGKQNKQLSKSIIASLKESAIIHPELGMYWKEWSTGGYYWHQAPIEAQAMMIEAFVTMNPMDSCIDKMKIWLLRQKQTEHWNTTKSTVDACYALLLQGSNWLAEEQEISISVGKKIITNSNSITEAGSGYFIEKIEGKEVSTDMGNISVSIQPKHKADDSSTSISWGAVYWQYFEDMDKVTIANSPLQMNRNLYVERNGLNGPEQILIEENTELKVGDKLVVRLTVKSDRNMEYVYIKDMRAASLEPQETLSEYKYQSGTGYYRSIKDASVNFFIPYLQRGTYIFEYKLAANQMGNFSNGISTIQCLYAPEFSAHTEGARITVN